jgi:hypothetical protein
MRTGLVGYDCAQAIRDIAGSAVALAAKCKNLRRGSFIALPPPRQQRLSATPTVDELCLHLAKIDIDRPAQQRVQAFEGDCIDMHEWPRASLTFGSLIP